MLFVWLAYVMLVAGWYLFVYLRTSLRTRVTVLVGLGGGAFLIGCVADVVFSPVVPH